MVAQVKINRLFFCLVPTLGTEHRMVMRHCGRRGENLRNGQKKIPGSSNDGRARSPVKPLPERCPEGQKQRQYALMADQISSLFEQAGIESPHTSL